MRRIVVPLIFGLLATAILASLGFWQLRRLDEKQAQLAQIQAGMSAPPRPLPAAPDPSMKYAPVTLSGRTTGQEILVVSGSKEQGGGYSVISAFETADGRRVLLDRGFVPQQDRGTPRPPVALNVAGHLHWPQDAGSATPPPDAETGIWFARDVEPMARSLGTEPVLVVAASVSGDLQGVTPVPVSVDAIPNNHLGYAVQWFLFALTFAAMTIWLIWRISRRSY